VIKRIGLLIAVALMAIIMMTATAAPAFAVPGPCEPGTPGCKTQDDPDKNNPKFTESSRAQFDSAAENPTDCHTNPNDRVIC
jgi:hypothetical protein